MSLQKRHSTLSFLRTVIVVYLIVFFFTIITLINMHVIVSENKCRECVKIYVHVKQCQTSYFWAPKSLQMVIAAMKLRCLLLGRKVMTNLDSILKSRDITLPTKVHLVKAMVFPVVMYGCESWTVKKAEHQKIDAFELWCWRRLMRVPWTARRSN